MPEGKNRTFGLNHGAGKGDKTRVTDKKAYDENFDAIDWSSERTGRTRTRTGRTLQELHDEWEFRHGL